MLSWQEVRSFARVTALCGTFGPLFTGVGSVADRAAPPTLTTIALILGVGLAFHVFAYVLNDVVDLPIDRSEPRRSDFPLVTGRVSRSQALAVSVGCIPVGLGLAALQGPIGAVAVLALAYGTMAVYDVWGKRSRLPVLTDLVQGLSWAALLWWAATATGQPRAMTAWLAGSIVVFILLANGVHGSLRDLANDLRCGARSTAIALGARPLAGGGVAAPPTLTWYAAVLHALVIVGVGAAVLSDPTSTPVTIALVALVAAVATALAGMAWDARGDGWLMRRLGLLHLAVLLLLPLVAVAHTFDVWMWTAVVVAVIGPILANSWLPTALRAVASPRARRPS